MLAGCWKHLEGTRASWSLPSQSSGEIFSVGAGNNPAICRPKKWFVVQVWHLLILGTISECEDANHPARNWQRPTCHLLYVWRQASCVMPAYFKNDDSHIQLVKLTSDWITMLSQHLEDWHLIMSLTEGWFEQHLQDCICAFGWFYVSLSSLLHASDWQWPCGFLDGIGDQAGSKSGFFGKFLKSHKGPIPRYIDCLCACIEFSDMHFAYALLLSKAPADFAVMNPCRWCVLLPTWQKLWRR